MHISLPTINVNVLFFFKRWTYPLILSLVLTLIWLHWLHICSGYSWRRGFSRTAKKLVFSEGGKQWQFLYFPQNRFNLTDLICVMGNYRNGKQLFECLFGVFSLAFLNPAVMSAILGSIHPEVNHTGFLYGCTCSPLCSHNH